MLVLKREVGQRILIGPSIKVTVTKIDSDGVKLGIQAPKHVRVLREEVPGSSNLSALEGEIEIDRLREAVMLLSQKLGWTAMQTDEWLANL